jgi:hypothetical protein
LLGVVLKVHAPSEETSDHSKDCFYEELDRGFDHYPKHHMTIFFVDFNAKLWRKDILKPTIGNESLLQSSNDNGVRTVNFATPKNLVVKSTMFPHRKIHKHTWTPPEGRLTNRLITY